ncbi:hypothetical protein [Polluticoccus soli]|uniref:hypothetical protein n=1 Tax=Polluticoccus soli TaxID=3034150 RepID=UPI0023E25DFB|nr:hypothetical protein [Flavipsychrobacter sp. JY13-12]
MNDNLPLPFLLRYDAWVLVIILFLLMIVFIRLGAYFGRHRKRKEEYQDNPANSTVYGSILGLLAFILGFTFSMSGTRYENRHQAIVNEANCIGTAILRADIYPDSDRTILRTHFKNYLQARIDYIKAGPDLNKIAAADKALAHHQALLWGHAVWFSKHNPSILISGQMLPWLTDMFDAAEFTRNSEIIRVPQSVVIMLFSLSLIGAFFLGYLSVGKGRFDWVTGIGFCVLSSIVIFITLDLDRPRRGLIDMDASWYAIISQMSNFENQ